MILPVVPSCRLLPLMSERASDIALGWLQPRGVEILMEQELLEPEWEQVGGEGTWTYVFFNFFCAIF